MEEQRTKINGLAIRWQAVLSSLATNCRVRVASRKSPKKSEKVRLLPIVDTIIFKDGGYRADESHLVDYINAIAAPRLWYRTFAMLARTVVL